MLLNFNSQEVDQAIRLLHPTDGELFEIRLVCKNPKYIASGIFSSADTAVNALRNYTASWNKENLAKAANIYISINSPTQVCYSLVQRDRFVENVPTLQDEDISSLNWLFIDLDPERKAGVSSSNEELNIADRKSHEIYNYMQSIGFNDPIIALSSNGFHLMYRLKNLDNTEDNITLVKDTLKAISTKFSDDKVKVDDVNFNPSRICKLWGTLSQKGSDTPERPHRMSQVIYIPPNGIYPNDAELMRKVIEDCAPDEPAEQPKEDNPAPSANKSYKPQNTFNLDDFISKHNISVKQIDRKSDGDYYILESCLFDTSHTGKDAAIIRKNDGKLCYKCFHNSCSDKHWQDVRLLYEPDAYNKKANNNKGDNVNSENKYTPLLTPDTFEKFCKRYGISFKWDIIKHEMTYHGFDPKESIEHLRNNVPTILQGMLKQEGYRAASIENICGCISVIGTRTGNRFNAILDLINGVEWDGKDRLEQLYNMWQIPLEDKLSRSLFLKWLKQCICMLHNDYDNPWSADIVLVLAGAQGASKTRFFEHLAMVNRYFGEGKSLNPDNKDSIIEATSVWICELGEIGSTMRKDVDKVKATVTLASDEYRVPYGRTTERHPRLTSFCGTVNDEQFLLDQTGNRRWATIQLPKTLKLDYNTQIKPFDSLQLWAQINSMINEDISRGDTYSNCFRLTPDEQDALTERNNSFTKPMKGYVEISDIMWNIENNILEGYELDYHLMSATDFKMENDEVLRSFNANQIGQVLKKLGYEQTVTRIEGKQIRGYNLPYHKSIKKVKSSGYTVGDGWLNGNNGQWAPPPSDDAGTPF